MLGRDTLPAKSLPRKPPWGVETLELRAWIAIGVFILGTMYLWSSPAFVKPTDVRPGAPIWSERFFAPSEIANSWSRGLLGASLLVVLLFGVAAFGLWRGAGGWWTWAGLGAAILGFLVLIPWWVAIGGDAPAMSILVNAVLTLWSVGIAVVLSSPALRAMITRFLEAG